MYTTVLSGEVAVPYTCNPLRQDLTPLLREAICEV